MSLFDMTAAKDERFLYRKKPKVENGSGSGPEETCAHEVAHPLHIAGKLWEIRFSPALCLKDSFNRYQSISTLIGALLITVLLAYYLHKKMIYTVEIEGAIQAVREANEQLEDEVWIRKHEEAKLITAKKHLESEIQVRTETEKKLTQALAEVKTLRGILPLCSYCKKIRDDKGYWEQVDVYLLKHSQADVSHGICPDCLKRHFPDEYGKMIEEDQSGD